MASRAGIIFLFIFSSSLGALAPETPWTEVDKQLYLEPFVGYKHLGPFPNKRASHDLCFQGLDLYASPDPEWQILLEGMVAETHQTRFLFDHLKAAISYQMTDDIQGDCFSSMLSFSGTTVNGRALTEPALFHFGEWEWRGTLSLGKESTQWTDWIYRTSGYATFGIANRGSPWIEAGIAFERNWEECQRLTLHFDLLQGLGGKNVDRTPFRFGWAPFRFTLIYVGGSYTKVLPCGEATLYIERTVATTGTFANVSSAILCLSIPY